MVVGEWTAPVYVCVCVCACVSMCAGVCKIYAALRTIHAYIRLCFYTWVCTIYLQVEDLSRVQATGAG